MAVGFRVLSGGAKVGRDVVDRFRSLPVANVSDFMNRMSAGGTKLRPMHAGGVLVGPAVTVKTRPGDNLMMHKAFDVAVPGDVIVVDAGGDVTNALIGENAAAYAESLGLAGVVINGAIRDSAAIAARKFPIFSIGITHRGPYKDGPGEVNVPISIDGMVIAPGDLILGDADGVVCVPRERAEEVYAAALAKHRQDEKDARAVIEGKVDRAWLDAKLRALGCEFSTLENRSADIAERGEGARLVNIGQAIVECCRVEGVRHVFGLIGSSHLEIVDAIARSNDIRFVGVRHEQAAAFMADAYARATGGVGIVLTSSGPGVSNTITGIALAKRAYSPVISLGGATKTAFEQMDAKQEIDQLNLMRPVTKEVLRINRADRAVDIMRQAFRIALSGQRGPVHVDIPRDLLPTKLEFEFPAPATYRATSHPTPAREEILRALDLIAKAKRPLILAGGGVKWSGATRELIELAERFNLPVVTSDGHRDVMPNDHPLFFGQLGPRGSASAKELGLKADLIFALGTRLGFTTTLFNNSFISKDATIIQSDIEPTEIGRVFPIALGLVGDAGAIAAACVLESRKREGLEQLKEWRTFAEARRAAWLAARDHSADGSVPIRTGRAFTELRRAAPRNMLVTVDAGHWGAIATDAFDHYECPTLFTPLDYASLGFSFPAALGLKCARPDAPVLSINGDGGFAMNMQEIETAVRMRLNPVVMVFNNFAWGTEKAHQRDTFDGNYLGVDLTNPRFDQLAQLFGARGLRVERPGDLAEAVASSFKHDLPTIIDVIVDPNDLEILT